MKPAKRGAPGVGEWEESLLSMDTEKLLAIVRHYVGPVRSPWDKRSVVARLSTFARRPETVEAILGLMDGLDAAIVCTVFLVGPLGEGELRDLFSGEIRAFDLGVRLANLEDRLVLFRPTASRGGLLALNPTLGEEVGRWSRDLRVVLGGASSRSPGGEEEDVEGLPPRANDGPDPLLVAMGFFAFLFHNPGCVRKDGSLSKKASARLEACFTDRTPDTGREHSILAAFIAAGILVRRDGEGGYDADAGSFSDLLRRHGVALPLRLALALAGLGADADPLVGILAASLASLPAETALPAGGLARWLGIAARRAGFGPDSGIGGADDGVVEALLELGLLGRSAEGLVTTRRIAVPKPLEGLPVLVADGSHLLRVLPEADLQARWFAIRIARPLRLGLVWELELDRITLREAFASGLSSVEIARELARLGARPLPQSLAFSIESWEGEFRSTRLISGWVLVCDERKRAIVEGRPDLSSLVRERLAPGVYLLDTDDEDEIVARLGAAGIEAPPPIRPHGRPAVAVGAEVPVLDAPHDVERSLAPAEIAAEASDAVPEAADRPPREPPRFDPSGRIETLRAALATRMEAADPSARERLRELADRIEARLVVDEAHIDRADVIAVRVEATSLDYAGKVRLAERAVASPGDRLQIRYQLPGGDPETVTVRPVRIQKTERGHVLEGEDLAAGTPVRVPLGAASMVRRLRATPFGEER